VLELSFIGLTRFNPPLISTVVAANPTLPNLLENAQAAIPSGLVVPDPNTLTPYAQHLNLRIERELFGPRSVVGIAYVGTSAVKLPRNSLPNGGDGLPQAQRPDPATGVVNYLRTDASSRYDGLEATMSWRASGFYLRGSYTFSKSLDVVSDYPSSNTGIERQVLLLDENNMRLNRGPSDFDIRHVGSVAYSYDLPFASGWQVQGITSLISGRPYTLYSGTDTPFGSNSNRIMNTPGSLVRGSTISLAPGFTTAQLTPARGTFGTIGRNTESGDSLVQFNLSVGKTFAFGERARLQFRTEAFNLFNTVNYDLPDGLLTSRNFGQPVSAFDARQMQFAMKLTF
jgi:hypothetical protein